MVLDGNDEIWPGRPNAGVAFGTDGKHQHGTDALPMALTDYGPWLNGQGYVTML